VLWVRSIIDQRIVLMIRRTRLIFSDNAERTSSTSNASMSATVTVTEREGHLAAWKSDRYGVRSSGDQSCSPTVRRQALAVHGPVLLLYHDSHGA
jgi:hypothetical protein